MVLLALHFLSSSLFISGSIASLPVHSSMPRKWLYTLPTTLWGSIVENFQNTVRKN